MNKKFFIMLLSVTFFTYGCSDSVDKGESLPYGFNLKTKSEDFISVDYESHTFRSGIWYDHSSQGKWEQYSRMASGNTYQKAILVKDNWGEEDLFVRIDKDDFKSIILKGYYRFISYSSIWVTNNASFHHAKKCLPATDGLVATMKKYRNFTNKNNKEKLTKGECYFNPNLYKAAASYDPGKLIPFKRRQLEGNAFEFVFSEKLDEGYYAFEVDNEYWWFELY
jgi:hypothetical protein